MSWYKKETYLLAKKKHTSMVKQAPLLGVAYLETMREQYLYTNVYFELPNSAVLSKYILCFSCRCSPQSSVFYIFSSKYLAYGNNRTLGLSQSHHLAFGQRDDDYPCRPAQVLCSGRLPTRLGRGRGEEFGNLQAIRDNYPKYVVLMDPVSGGLPEYPGIMHIHLREFLMTDF